jgi:putative ABC transport system ATP-binding protein
VSDPDAAAGGEPAPSAAGYAVELRDVVKRYPGGGGEPVVALDHVDFAVRPGEFVAVVGPSGSGKSTLLNVLGLLDDPTSGQRLLDGTDVTSLSVGERTAARKESIGFVFQDFHLLPTLTAVENVALPTAFDPGDASDRAAELLARFGLGERLDHEPTELSGGQKQRVAIARALINEPGVLLADEPTGNLDTETGEAILGEFERVKSEGVAVIAVTHDPLVEEYADRVVDLTDGVLTGGLPADDDAGPPREPGDETRRTGRTRRGDRRTAPTDAGGDR